MEEVNVIVLSTKWNGFTYNIGVNKMKKMMIISALTACAAVVAAETVTSANIVGYNKDTLPVGLKISGYQFSADETLDDIYGGQYPEGTKLYTYTAGAGYGASATYETYFDLDTYQNVTGWNPATVTLSTGQGYWLDNSSGSVTEEAVVSGEVPSADVVTNNISIGLQLIAYPYPVAMNLVDMEFSPTEGDKVYTYNAGTGYGDSATYESYFDLDTYQTVTGWNPNDVTVDVGEGVWYEAVADQLWIVNRPFDM
jgi:plastocyanin domain-containing protein